MTRHYPLVFGFHDLVEGKGFLAVVRGQGRALAAEEEDGWWMFGVTPGGLAEGGKSLTEAHLVFLNALKKVLFDIASEAGSFEDFHRSVTAFFEETNKPTAQEWRKAVEQVRAGKVTLDLPKASAEDKPHLVVELKQALFSPEENKVDDEPRLAAA